MPTSSSTVPWPQPSSVAVHWNRYETPDGTFARVTHVLEEALGLGARALRNWAVEQERMAVLEAAADIYAADTHDGPAHFIGLVEQRLGAARKGVEEARKAAEIGTLVHQTCWAWLKDPSYKWPDLPDQVEWAVMAFQDWWSDSGLKVVLNEQPVWDAEFRYAGTIDLVVDGKDGPGIMDLKSSKAIWDKQHLQVVAYKAAAMKHLDIRWAKILRVPKNLTDPGFEVKDLGDMWNRRCAEDELMRCFRAALTVYHTLIAKR